MSARGVLRAAFLGTLLGLHLFTRLHAQFVTPLQERHFYPTSYYVALSLLQGSGFHYLVPASTVFRTADRLPDASRDVAAGDPRAAVVDFIQLAGPVSLTATQVADYASADTRLADVGPFETTRILDIHLTALLWRVFGVSWVVYFSFYALLSTAAAFALFLITQSVTGSYWSGLAATAGFLASPLEHYAGAWSTRDTVPLWFTSLAFCALAWFVADARPGRRMLPGAAGVGFASLIGLGWRPDFQLLPPLFLGALVVLLAARGVPWRQIGSSVAGFVGGCLSVLLLLRALGPATYTQGGTVFHTAWYGEAQRSNLLRTENAFQVARDDYLTLYQANYFARGRSSKAVGITSPTRKDELHYRRCREMFSDLARYDAYAWWSAFPSFLARSLQIDKPTLLGSETEAAMFRAQRPVWLEPAYRLVLDRYGRLLPWLVGLGLAGGLVQERTRWLTTLLAGYFVYSSAAILLVLPESKHMLPLLLPIHVLAAIGLWSLTRAVRSWRRWRALALASHRALFALALAFAALLAAWSVLGILAHRVSRQERARLIAAVHAASSARSTEVPVPTDGKVLSVRPASDSTTPEAYLFKVHAARQANILCLHVREDGGAEGGPLVFYTRHSIAPGDERSFFLNLVTGAGVGDTRRYTAYLRLVGPVEVVSIRKMDLSSWPLGLPLSFVFDENDNRAGASLLAGPGASTEQLPSWEVGHLLAEPGAFLRSYRPE